MRFVLLALACFAAVPRVAYTQERPDASGTELRLELNSGLRITGELIAVDLDSVFLADPTGIRRFAIGDIRHARVPQSGMSSGGIMTWTLVGGLLSGLGLMAACTSVEDANCGGVIPSVALTWAVFGGLSALVTGPSTRPVNRDPATLARYARFPQGMPEGFAIAGQEARPDAKR